MSRLPALGTRNHCNWSTVPTPFLEKADETVTEASKIERNIDPNESWGDKSSRDRLEWDRRRVRDKSYVREADNIIWMRTDLLILK